MRKPHDTAHLCRIFDAGNMRCAIQRRVEGEKGERDKEKWEKNERERERGGIFNLKVAGFKIVCFAAFISYS